MKHFIAFNRYLLLGFWLAFLVNIVMPFSAPWESGIMNVGLVLVAIHILELALVYKKLKLIGRANVADLSWVILLGILHWRPLLRK